MADVTPSVPVAQSSGGPLNRLNVFLDKYVLPYPVKYLTNRITILATLCFVIPLIVLANLTQFELAVNSYLNVMSVVVSSTVLLYSTLAEARDRAAAERREQIAEQHQQAIDDRAAADHAKIEEIHAHINEIQQILIDHLEKLQDEDHAHIETMNKAVLEGIAAHHEELDDLHKLLETIQSNKGGKN